MGRSRIKAGTMEAETQRRVDQPFKGQDPDSLRGSRKLERPGSVFREPVLGESAPVVSVPLHPESPVGLDHVGGAGGFD